MTDDVFPMDDRQPDASEKANPAVADEALHWLVRRLDSASWTDADEAALKTWLAASPDHEREFRRNQAVVARMSRPDVFRETIRKREASAQKPRQQRKRVGTWVWTGALATAALLVFAFIVTRPHRHEQAHEYLTGIGERREVTLPDGSRVHLNAQTRLVSRFDKNKRGVDLLAGAATFQVTPDAAHPFEVIADTEVIRVVGTHFEVRFLSPGGASASGRRVSIAVTEGVVDVRGSGAKSRPTDAVRLSAGRKGIWRADHAAPEIKALSENAFAVWRSGRLRCEGEPLADVLVELGCYFPGRIELKEPALGELRVSGTLPLDDWQAAAQLLESVLPIRVRLVGDNRLVVESAARSGDKQS